MTTTELLATVRRVEVRTNRLVNDTMVGAYLSHFKGRGMDFEELREYMPGDDVRNIDWNVTARTGVPFIKVFEEERELTVMLVIDMSRSAFFGTQAQFKSEMMTEICAVLAFSAINNNDKVGVIFFSDRIEKFIPPKKGRGHILLIIRELINFEPKGSGTDLSVGLAYLNSIIKKRSICFFAVRFHDAGL